MAFLGIDLGGTKIFGVRLDKVDDDEPAKEAKVATPTGADAVVEAIASVIEELGGRKGVHAIGIGAPGVIPPGSGTVTRAPNLAGVGGKLPLAELVAKAIGGGDVVVDNDVNVATLGEHAKGAGKGADDLLGCWVGTGVGGGLVLGGKLRAGPNGSTGEIGHVVVRPGGRPCGCGGLGHLESYAGRGSLEREARRLHEAGTTTKLVELAGAERMKSSIWGKAVDAGDEVALALIDEAVEALGVGLAGVFTTIDLERIVLGGGLADRLGASFAGRVEQAIKSNLTVGGSRLRVVPGALGDRSGAIGAALLAAGR